MFSARGRGLTKQSLGIGVYNSRSEVRHTEGGMNSSWRMHLSWLFLAAGGLWGISMSRNGGGGSSSNLQMALMIGYMVWSLYWGLPPFWGWWRRVWLNASGAVGCFSGGLANKIAIAITVLVFGSCLFSVFGGGIYHFVRHWRSARFQL